jgi:hypothetical protein
MGAANQFRAIGSTVMVAISTATFNGFVFPKLSGIGISDPNRVVQTYGKGRTGISPEVWNAAKGILSQGYDRQMLVLMACAAAQAAVALLMWKKKNDKSTAPMTGLNGSQTGTLTKVEEQRTDEANV